MKQIQHVGLFLSLLIFSMTLLKGQDGQFPKSKEGTGTVYGKVIDAESEKGLAFANVALYLNGSKQPTEAKNTKEGGRFIFRDLAYGNYTLEISFLGMGSYVSEAFLLDKSHAVVPMGGIYLSSGSNEIEEVNVTGRKTTEQISLVKKVFNVSENVNNAGGTALDAMRNIPALFVGIDGDIQLRGSSNVKVLVNGRPSSLIGSGGELNLEQLSAASIEAIEVITNPSAKYDASGKTGIINIILKKPIDQGFNYNYNFMVGTKDKWSIGLSMNYRTEHWNWRGGYQFIRRSMVGFKDLNQKSIIGDTSFYLDQTSIEERLRMGHTANVGFDWSPNEKVTVYSTVTVNPHIGQKDSEYDYTFFDINENYDNNSLRKTVDDEEKLGTQVELGVDKKFSRKGMTWNSSYNFNNGTKADSILSEQDYYFENNLLETLFEKNRRDQTNQSHRFQTDFTYPFSKDTKLETGVMLSSRNLENDFKFFDQVGSEWISNAERTNDFSYDEQIAAGYVMGTARIKRWDLNAGLRVENTDVLSKLASASEEYPNTYLNFFPSGHIGYDVLTKGKGTVLLTYSRRIKRPSYRRLNPFVSYNDNQNIRFGNPLLKPELTDSWEIGWQSRWKKGSVSPALFYRRTVDKMDYNSSVLPSGVRQLTFVNLNESVAKGAEINGSYSPIKQFRLSGNVSYFFVEKDGENLENPTSNEGDMWMSRLMASIHPTKQFAIQLSGFYTSGFIGIFGESKPIRSMDLGMSYMAFKKRGKFIFKVSDVFLTRRFEMQIRTPELETDFSHRRESRVFWIGFNWELKQSKHKKRRGRRESGGGDMEM